MDIIGMTAAINNLYPCRIEQKVYEVIHMYIKRQYGCVIRQTKTHLILWY